MNSVSSGLVPAVVGLSIVAVFSACTAGDPLPNTTGAGAASGGASGSPPGGSSTTQGAYATGGMTSTSSTGDPGFDITTGMTTEDSGDTGEDKPEAMIELYLPAGFTAAENGGGYLVVGALEDLELEASNSCRNILRVVVRDFLQSHIDFGERKPADFMNPGLYPGQLLADLDPTTRKPTVNPSRLPSDLIENFSDWYENTPGVNKPYVMDIWLQPQPNGLFLFDTASFFPLEAPWDGFSAGDMQASTTGPRNFLFTTEIHTAFEYKGTEVFNFRGDDDVWIFINNKLAVDIGGIHGPQVGNVVLAERAVELGLAVGEVYRLDMFQAERNPTGSNFRIETSLDFKECGVLENDIIR